MCVDMRAILESNEDVFGKDKTGVIASELNLAVVDPDGLQADLLACTDLRTLLSPQSRLQIWMIHTEKLEKCRVRLIDESTLLAGYFKHEIKPKGRLVILMYTLSSQMPLGYRNSVLRVCLRRKPECLRVGEYLQVCTARSADEH
jgi:hypothetical protein